jgi:hypothetical protein
MDLLSRKKGQEVPPRPVVQGHAADDVIRKGVDGKKRCVAFNGSSSAFGIVDAENRGEVNGVIFEKSRLRADNKACGVGSVWGGQMRAFDSTPTTILIESTQTGAIIDADVASIQTPFIGREREMVQLCTGLQDACAGRGRLFLIAGEPGIGKTRLMDEVARYAASGLSWCFAQDAGKEQEHRSTGRSSRYFAQRYMTWSMTRCSNRRAPAIFCSALRNSRK